MPRPEQKEFQISFPEFPSFQVNPRERKPPQPHPGPDRVLVGYDLVFPLNLARRGRIGRWLGKLEFPLGEVLGDREEKMIGLYFTSQAGRWLGQKEVAAQIGWSEKREKAVSSALKFALFRIHRRAENGSEAIEKLKLPHFLYRSLLEAGIAISPEIPKINDEKRIQQICGGQFGLELLKEALASQGIDWQPKIEFPKFPSLIQKIPKLFKAKWSVLNLQPSSPVRNF